MLPRMCNGRVKNFSVLLDDLNPYYNLILSVVNLPLPEHKHIEILHWGGLWKVDNNVTLIFKVAECHFKTITSVPTTKTDCKSIVSTLMKHPIIHENMPKIRSKLTNTIMKKEITLNLFEDHLTLCIRVRTFSFAKGQIQSNKTNANPKMLYIIIISNQINLKPAQNTF